MSSTLYIYGASNVDYLLPWYATGEGTESMMPGDEGQSSYPYAEHGVTIPPIHRWGESTSRWRVDLQRASGSC